MNDLSSEIRLSADVMLGAALDIASELLECGAEIQRIEDTVNRICTAYGAVKVDVFAITSLITATVSMPDGYHKTQTRRVYTTHTDFRRIEELNALSRSICESIPEPYELEKLVKKHRTEGRKNYVTRYVGACVMVAAFTVFFGGGAFDALAASAVSLIMMTMIVFKPRWANDIAHTVLCSLAGGLLCLGLYAAGLGANADAIMIGTIMLLVPGADVGNSMRDLLCGDIASGSMRLIRTLLSSTAIAVGYSIAILLGNALRLLGDYEPAVVAGSGVGAFSTGMMLLYIIAGLIGTFGYSMTNRVRAIRIPFVLLGGLLTVACWYWVCLFTENLFLSNMAAAMLATLYAEITARLTKAPTTIYLIPAVIPLVPGGRLYYSMLGIVRSDFQSFAAFAKDTFFIALGIAVGIVIVTSVAGYIFRIIRSMRRGGRAAKRAAKEKKPEKAKKAKKEKR